MRRDRLRCGWIGTGSARPFAREGAKTVLTRSTSENREGTPDIRGAGGSAEAAVGRCIR